MLWILFVGGGFGAIFFFVTCVVAIFFDLFDWDDIIWYWGIKMVICIVLAIVGFLGLCGIDSLYYDEVSQTGNWELVSITDDSQISGKSSSGLFYILVIDTEEVYSFYYRVNDDGVRRGEAYTDTTTIYEKDDCTPHVVEYTTYTKNKMNSILRIILTFEDGESSQKTYEIYTPTGTILRTFNLDLQ